MYYTLENFIDYCENTQIANEGIGDLFRRKVNSMTLNSSNVRRVNVRIDGKNHPGILMPDSPSLSFKVIIMGDYSKTVDIDAIQDKCMFIEKDWSSVMDNAKECLEDQREFLDSSYKNPRVFISGNTAKIMLDKSSKNKNKKDMCIVVRFNGSNEIAEIGAGFTDGADTTISPR